MNYLSHFYFAKKPLNDPFYTLGLIYPDLNREHRKESYGNLKLKEGLEEHIDTAKKFHRLPWFQELESKFGKQNTTITFRFTGMLYHWAMEIAIDYELSPQEELVKKVNENLNNKELLKFLKDNNTSVLQDLKDLKDNDTFTKYGTKKGCIQALGRSYKKVLIKYPQLKSNALSYLDEVFEQSLLEIKPRMKDILYLLAE